MQNESLKQVAKGVPENNTVLEFKPENSVPAEPVNEQLKDHQIKADGWDQHELVKTLHVWAERFIFEFKLKTSTPAIMIDCINHNWHGRYRYGRNGFGIRNEIAINEMYLDEQEFWEILGTLLHELLHAEQEETGKPGKHNYHNKAFRERAEPLGLIVDQWGVTEYAPAPSPFLDVLAKYGVEPPVLSISKQASMPLPSPPSKAKLKLWTCKCTPKPVRVRVAIQDFQAKCLKCGSKFVQQN